MKLIYNYPDFSLYFNNLEQDYIIQINLKNNLFFKWIYTLNLFFIPIGIYTEDNTTLYELPQNQKQKFLITVMPMSEAYMANFIRDLIIDKTNDILNNVSIPDSIKLLLNL